MSKSQKPRRTQRYPDEFKSKIVELTRSEGVTNAEIAIAFDIHPMMISRWRKEYREGNIVTDERKKVAAIKKEKKKLDEYMRLKKENARLKLEIDLLKKWQRFQAEERQKVIDSSRSMEKD